MPPRGLAKTQNSLRTIRAVTIGALLLAAGMFASLLAAPTPASVPFLHSLAVIVIALVTYSWVLFSMGVGAAISAVVLIEMVWAWAASRALLIGLDLVALIILVIVACVQQRRRTMRLQRLAQALDDLDEESYVKDQNLRLSRQTCEALRRKSIRYQRLQWIAEQLAKSVDLDAIAQLAVAQAFELIGKSDACLLFLVDHQHQELALQAVAKSPDSPVIRTKRGDQFDRFVLRTHRPLLVNDVQRDFRFSQSGQADRAIRAVVACPIRVGESAEGVLRLDSREAGIYAQDDLRFLDILLDLVNTAIANAQLFARTQQLALTDGLTGLYRHQPMLDHLTREIARANRSHEPVAVLMIDLDDFKAYNDQYGHPAGDAVLKAVGEALRQSAPPEALSARYGGEEFAVVLPKANRDQAVRVAEQIRQAVHDGTRRLASAGRPVTASIGVALFPEDGASSLEMIRRADERLYEAKRLGKNRVWNS